MVGGEAGERREEGKEMRKRKGSPGGEKVVRDGFSGKVMFHRQLDGVRKQVLGPGS